MDKEKIKCPKCGHENDSSSGECAKCGINYSLYSEAQERLKKEEKEKKKNKDLIPEKEIKKEKTVKCPQCGHVNTSTESCSKCGIIFSKYYEIQKREEQERAEALRRQKEEEKKAGALRKEKEEQERAEALTKQKEEEGKAEALRKQKEEQEKEELEKEELEKRKQKLIKDLRANPKIKDLLRKYEERDIGINYDNPKEIKEAHLIKVNDEYFSIFLVDQGLIYSYPLRNIISVVEKVGSAKNDDHSEKLKFPLIVQVYHLVV